MILLSIRFIEHNIMKYQQSMDLVLLDPMHHSRIMIDILLFTYKIEYACNFLFSLILYLYLLYLFIYFFADQAISQTIVEVCGEYRKLSLISFGPYKHAAMLHGVPLPKFKIVLRFLLCSLFR